MAIDPTIISPKPGELKPCPFCGSAGGLEHDAVGEIGNWYVFCRDTDPENPCPIGYTNTIGYARRVEAASAWNGRVA